MTVSSSTNRASYSGNGSLTTFAYGFKVFDQDDLTVILRASNGTETVQTITTDYTVTGVGDVGGGNVVFGTAPASGVTVVILREMDLEQGLDLVPNDPFPAQSLEDSLDKLTFMVQQHDEQLGRAIKASRTNVITGSEFVISAADRANKVFAFDSSGDVSITQEIGTFRGDWAASTAYVERDLVKDTTTNNVFIVNSAHTSSGSLPLTTNTNSAKYEKIIDITNPPGDLTVGGNISTSGSVTAGNFVIGSADINENDLEAIDSIIAGTVAASKAVVVDVNKDISSFRNLTAAGDITFGGLSDGTITVTDILDEDDLTSNSATSLATQQSIKAYVDSQVGSFDTLAEVLSNGNTTGGTNLSVSTGDDIKFADGSQAIFGAGDDLRINHTGSNSYISDLGTGPLFIGGNEEVSIMNGQLNEYKIKAETNGAVTLYYDNAVKMATTSLGIDVTGTITFDGGETTADLYFGDNDKAIFGAGSDLQIYHDGASGQSIIHENGPSVLKIRASDFRISNADNTADYLSANDGAEVSIRYNGAPKLATTSTGVDVTGTITADDHVYIEGNAARLSFGENDTTDLNTRFSLQSGSFRVETVNDSFASAANRISVDNSTGDISFYEDTGTTPKMVWKSADERLGIGTSSPSVLLHIKGANPEYRIEDNNETGSGNIVFRDSARETAKISVASGASANMQFQTLGSEAMRIDSSGNVGIGVTDPDCALEVQSSASGLNSVHLSNTSSTGYGAKFIGGGNTSTRYIADFRDYSGASKVKIDGSGNVGIGTDSPSQKFQVKDTTASNTSTYISVISGTAGNAGITFGDSSSTLVGGVLYNNADNALRFFKNGFSEAMRIDSSGNVGIGLSSSLSGLNINGSVRSQNSASNISYMGFTSYTGTTAAGAMYSYIGGDGRNTGYLNFSTNDTERMRIDSSGNLLVGKTSSSASTTGAELQKGSGGQSALIATAAGTKVGIINRTTSDGDLLEFRKDGTTVGSIGTLYSDIYIGTGDTGLKFTDSSNVIVPLNTSTLAERDAAVSLGQSGTRFKDLYLSGDVDTSGVFKGTNGTASAPTHSFLNDPDNGMFRPTTNAVGFSTGGSERMRLDSSGNLLVGGATTVGYKFHVYGDSAFERTGTTSQAMVVFRNGNGNVGSIYTSGSSTSYNTSSDYRLKTDAQPMTGASARVQTLNPVNFEWIADGTRVDGFLAHEAQAVVPEAVTGTKDAMRDEEYEVTPAVYEDVVIPAVLDDEGNELEAERTEQQLVTEAVMGTRSVPDYQGIDQSKLVPLLTAALQEALTKIDALETRITALEG